MEYAATYAELQAIVTYAVAMAFGLTGVIWWLAKRIEDGCPECPHCVGAKRDRKAAEEARDRAFAMRYYNWDGKEAEPRKARPRSGPVGDEGPPDEMEPGP